MGKNTRGKSGRRPQRGMVTIQQVHKMIGKLKERKTLFLANSAVTITTAGTVINFSNNCVQGDGTDQRTGNTIRSIRQRLTFRFFGITNNQTARVILFRDTQNNGSTPAVTDVLEQAIFQSAYSEQVYQAKRFTIYWDKTVDVSISGEDVKTLTTHLGETGNIYYNGATAVATSNGRNSVFLLVLGDNSTGRYDYGWEMIYHDD